MVIKKTCLAATLAAAALLSPAATAAVAAPAPDITGTLKAVRADPIGFVNWKLELPIPSQYVPVKPLVK
ncbi:hypothetical protein STVIR_8737 [Streptomyces viridochromogenes Tue57]|uniref:Secreted protein n=1 Tax=Streptomyces viridochromogenes Tue57 TaxID=1160705 RepID=L8P2I2_STRVR|nr:hypothetical protein STVIR_8737 [Streptomyces viridochromogenes Tue57]